MMHLKELDTMLPIINAIVSYVDEGVVIADQSGQILYHNQVAADLLGIPASRPIATLSDIKTVHLQAALKHARTGARDATDKASQNKPNFVRFTLQAQIHGHKRELEFHSCVADGADAGFQLIMIRNTAELRFLDVASPPTEIDLVTTDPAMQEIIERVHQVAPQNATVLLQGESGTGKTHIARMIHRLSKRADHSFVEINCAAIPENLLESELFGHVKGSFTGATQDRAGRFQAAHKGTLFLDEVGEIPLHLQAKLLRAVQDQEFEPVGSDKTVKVDVRIISASNRRLRDVVDKGDFRADLFYRLAVIPLYIPALRERPSDIPELLKHFCSNLEAHGFAGDVECTSEAMQMMTDYPWPGNVRELENAVEHALICAVDKQVLPKSLPQDIRKYSASRYGQPLENGDSESDQRAELEKALAQARGNKTLAAKYLGVDRTTLWRRCRKLNIPA